MILHHKDVSPFSEKIRLMFGYSGLGWQGVQATLQPPRPSIDPLVDGYRHIPVAQIGSDVFCDTQVISAEVAELAGKPELSPYRQTPEVRKRSIDLDNDAAMYAIVSAPPLGILRSLIRQVPVYKWPKYFKDKKYLFSVTKVEVDRNECKTLWSRHLKELNNQLADTPWVGGERPNLLDFCAVHPLWFRLSMDGRSLFKGLGPLEAWYDKMMAFGHGGKTEISPSESLAAARQSEPREVPDKMKQGKSLGQTVSIEPYALGTAVTTGVVVGEDENRWILARETETAGNIHVHLPKDMCEITSA